MRRFALALSLMFVPMLGQAETRNAVIGDIVEGHILPRFETLAERAQMLSDTAAEDCDPTSVHLRSAYREAFDAWVSTSHLRFGPTEVDDRAFALAFWPDSRGATPRALGGLIAEQDPVGLTVSDYEQVSIAARGFYALEFLLFDEALMVAGDPEYHCGLVQTMSSDIALTSHIILEDWQSGFAATIQNPTTTGIYRSDEEVLQEMFKALTTGLQFTADTRLGRPLGTFDRPRPRRAEAHRSGRSSEHVMLSLLALQDLAARLAGDGTALSSRLDAGFDRATSRLAELKDPVFAGVSDPQTRLKIEIIQQSVEAIRVLVRDELGPTLGVAAGFNALDGD